MSKVKTDREMTELTSANLARAEVEGSTRKEASYETIGTGSVSSVRMGTVHRIIDTIIQKEVRLENSKLAKDEALNDYYQKINDLFGTKGGKTSFVHGFGHFMNSVSRVANSESTISKREVIQNAIQFSHQMNSLIVELEHFQDQIDEDINNAVHYVNTALDEILELNRNISEQTANYLDTTNLEDERDLHILKIGENLKLINVDNGNNTVTLTTEAGRLLAVGRNTYKLQYTPGQPTSAVLDFNNLDISDEITEGKIAGLIELRNTIIPNFQAELNELTRVMRDTVNAVHNEGASLGGPATLTGMQVLPGVVGVPDGNTQIVGNGILRIGVTDSTGALLDYKDVDLSNGAIADINSLISIIGNTNYTRSGSTGPANGNGDFTVTQLVTGELQVTSTSGHTVALGSVNGTTAQISAGVGPFNPSSALGFSHFFGLNNLFETGMQVYSTAPQTDLADILQVKSVIAQNANYLAIGSLDGGTPPTNNIGLAQSKNDIALKMSDALKMKSTSFLPAGLQGATSTTIVDYSQRILAYIQQNINEAKEHFNYQKASFDQLAMRAHEISGVDPSTELLKIFELATSQQISSKALSIVQSMNRDLIQTIGAR